MSTSPFLLSMFLLSGSVLGQSIFESNASTRPSPIASTQPSPATQASRLPAINTNRPVDLRSNPLVNKALADQVRAVEDAGIEHRKRVEALEVEHQKKIEAAKTACIVALKRAEAVSLAKGQTEEALTIHALIDSMKAQEKTGSESIGANAGASSTPQPSAVRDKYVGKWIRGDGFWYILNSDGTVRSKTDHGTWKMVDEDIHIHWVTGGYKPVFAEVNGQWIVQAYRSNGTVAIKQKLTPPKP